MNILQQKQRIEYLAAQQQKIQEQRDEQKRKDKEFVKEILDRYKAKNQ